MLRVVSAEGRTPLTPPAPSPGPTRPAAPEFPARNHGMMEPLRLEKPSRIVQPNQHGRVTPNWCPQGATSKRSLEEPELGMTHPQRVWQLRFGMWDCPDNGVSPTMGFLPRARHLPSQPFSPWALSRCRIYPKRARAAFSPGGQSHSRPVQDFRTDLSTSPGPRYPRRSCWLCSQALSSAGSELSLTQVLATAASRCGSRCAEYPDASTNRARITGTTTATGSGIWGETQGEFWEEGNIQCSGWRLLSALPKLPGAIPSSRRRGAEQEANPWITGRVQWANPQLGLP